MFQRILNEGWWINWLIWWYWWRNQWLDELNPTILREVKREIVTRMKKNREVSEWSRNGVVGRWERERSLRGKRILPPHSCSTCNENGGSERYFTRFFFSRSAHSNTLSTHPTFSFVRRSLPSSLSTFLIDFCWKNCFSNPEVGKRKVASSLASSLFSSSSYFLEKQKRQREMLNTNSQNLAQNSYISISVSSLETNIFHEKFWYKDVPNIVW